MYLYVNFAMQQKVLTDKPIRNRIESSTNRWSGQGGGVDGAYGVGRDQVLAGITCVKAKLKCS